MTAENSAVILKTSLLVLMLIFTLSLAGCGFQLKQSADLPNSFGPVAITGLSPYSSMNRMIRNNLRQSSIEFVSDKTAANHTIAISNNREERRVLSVASSGKVGEYELIKVLSFPVYNNTGDKVIDTQTLSANRFYTVSGSDVLEDDREEADIKQQMEADLVDRMFRQIANRL